MDESLQAKYVPRAIVYNWARHIPTFLWELINDTNTSEGNDFGIINGKLLKPTDFQPKPVFYTIERTNALFADTVPDPTIGISVPDARSLEATAESSILLLWLPLAERQKHCVVLAWLKKARSHMLRRPVYVQMALQNSGIAASHSDRSECRYNYPHPLGDMSNAIRVPVRDSVMAIADASYFDWAVLPEVPGGLIAQPTGGAVDLKWPETRDASSIIGEGSFRILKSMGGRGGPRAGECHQLSSKGATAEQPRFIPHLVP